MAITHAGEFRFDVIHKDRGSAARMGILRTPHGEVPTPLFMPVGTAATVKALPQEILERLDCSILLANTYHLYLRPGHERIAKLGELHPVTRPELPLYRPVLTAGQRRYAKHRFQHPHTGYRRQLGAPPEFPGNSAFHALNRMDRLRNGHLGRYG